MPLNYLAIIFTIFNAILDYKIYSKHAIVVQAIKHVILVCFIEYVIIIARSLKLCHLNIRKF